MNHDYTSGFGPAYSRMRSLATYIGLALAIALTWCWANHCWTQTDWGTPQGYHGDHLAVLGLMKMSQEGDLHILGQDIGSRLGAPLGANYNDFPITEEYTFWTGGKLARWFGLMAASNLTVCLAHMLAGIGFLASCRRLGIRDGIGLPLALIFSANTFLAIKGLGHLGFSFLWHLPLGVVASVILYRQDMALSRKDWVYLLAVAAVTSVSNIYYTFILVQFWIIAATAATLREKCARKLIPIGVMLCVVVGGFLAMNMDTFSYAHENGPNLGATARNYQGMEIYSLKPLEMLLPPQKVPIIGDLTARYYRQRMLNSEPYSPYIGFMGIGGLLAIFMSAAIAAARRQPTSGFYWATIWVLLFSCLGGLNIILGYFAHFYAFRATTRFSIILLVLSLLFIALRVNALGRFRQPATIALWLLIPFCLLDQYPKVLRLPEVKAQTRATIETDRELVRMLNNRLPPEAAIFQLPVMMSPESPPIHHLHDYQHLRPFLMSTGLRFSYGNNKGRDTDKWQTDAASLPPREMVAALASYGFSAIMINKLGYVDQGAQLDQSLQALGLARFISGDWLVFTFAAAETKVAPPQTASYLRGWYTMERDEKNSWTWSNGSRSDILFQTARKSLIELNFELQSLNDRSITTNLNGTELAKIHLKKGERRVFQIIAEVKSGANTLGFATDTAPHHVAGDERRLAYALYNFKPVVFDSERSAFVYSEGWHESESSETDTFRWSSSNKAKIRAYLPVGKDELRFQIEGIIAQNLTIEYLGKTRSIELKPGVRTEMHFASRTGSSELNFISDGRPLKINGDSRALFFRIINLHSE